MQLTLNNWTTTLVAPAPAASLEMTVPAAEAARLGVIPGGDYYAATLSRVTAGIETAWEIVHITAISSGTLTVRRGQEGTTAIDWLEGERISVRVTSALLHQMIMQIAELTSATSEIAARVTALEGGEPPEDPDPIPI